VSVAIITFVVGTSLLRETKNNSITAEVSNQRGYSPVIFGVLIAISVVALVLADQFLTPTLNSATFNVQWFFRILALIIVVVSVGFALSRRGRSTDEPGVRTQPQVTGD